MWPLYALCLLSSLFATSCVSNVEKVGHDLTPSQINADRSFYHEKRVKVYGWMHSEFENHSLWQSEKLHSNGNYAADCVSLLIPVSMDAGRFNKRYVEVEGIYLKHLPENMIALGGCNVTFLQLLESFPPVITKK